MLFLALSVTFLFAYEISRQPLSEFAPNSQRRRVLSFARMSLKVKVKGQRSRSPGTKRHFSALSASECGLCLVKHLHHISFVFFQSNSLFHCSMICRDHQLLTPQTFCCGFVPGCHRGTSWRPLPFLNPRSALLLIHLISFVGDALLELVNTGNLVSIIPFLRDHPADRVIPSVHKEYLTDCVRIRLSSVDLCT